ncbi:DUF3336 domain-containing protein [Haliea sp.]
MIINYMSGSVVMKGSRRTVLGRLDREMTKARNYQQWSELAKEHDELSGMVKWKNTDRTSLYDYAEIRLRLHQLRDYHRQRDYQALLFTLNQGVHGNMGGMGRPALYARARYGTKRLIMEYIDDIVYSLDALATASHEQLNPTDKLDFFKRARHCFGRSALMLSGAGTLGLFHMGVIKALVEQDVLPQIISGSSAGAMIAAAVGTHTSSELKKFFDPNNIVVDAAEKKRFLDWILLGREGRLDMGYIEAMHAHFVRDLTFQEAYELTGHAINISVSPAGANQTSRLLNAITSPNVYIRSAVKASCAVPGAMEPVILEAKSTRGERVTYLPSRRWVDGSVSSDLPAKRLARLYGVNHFIVSQTNPLVLWAMTDPKLEQGIQAKVKRLPVRLIREMIEFNYVATKPLLRGSSSLSIAMGQLHSMVTQTYTGDINILPRYRLFDPRKLAKRWSQKEMHFLLREGEKATWPKIEMIRNCMKIGRKLDSILGDKGKN